MTVDEVGNAGVINDFKSQWIQDGLINMANQEGMTFG